jgi:hypothetical protein
VLRRWIRLLIRKERTRSQYKDALECLKAVFGYDAFRPGQRPVIDAVLDERCDAFVLWSTGSGKSLTFQIPALMFAGVTIVISPLIALMSDQVRALKSRRVAAECYNSSQKQTEQRAIVKAVQKGDVKLLYVSPERAVTAQFLNLLAALHARPPPVAVCCGRVALCLELGSRLSTLVSPPRRAQATLRLGAAARSHRHGHAGGGRGYFVAAAIAFATCVST